MIEEAQSLRDDAPSQFSDTTTLLDTYQKHYEPIRGTSDEDNVDLQHFTATGQPMPRYEHDHYSNMMGHGFGTTAVANTLPFKYTDASIITIPITISDLPGEPLPGENPPIPDPPPEKKGGFFRRLSASHSSEKTKKEIKAVKMTRGEYLKYWAKDEKGQYKADVVEPPGGRREWVKKQVELNEQWDREDKAAGRKESVTQWGMG